MAAALAAEDKALLEHQRAKYKTAQQLGAVPAQAGLQQWLRLCVALALLQKRLPRPLPAGGGGAPLSDGCPTAPAVAVCQRCQGTGVCVTMYEHRELSASCTACGGEGVLAPVGETGTARVPAAAAPAEPGAGASRRRQLLNSYQQVGAQAAKIILGSAVLGPVTAQPSFPHIMQLAGPAACRSWRSCGMP